MRPWVFLSLLFGSVFADSEDLLSLCRMFNTEENCLNILNNGASAGSSSSSAASSASASAASSSSSSASSSAAAAALPFGSSSSAAAAAAVTDGISQFGPFNPLTGGMMGPGFPRDFGGSPSISSSTSSNNGAVARTVTSVFPDGSATAAASAFAPGVPGLPVNYNPCYGVPPPFRGQCYRRLSFPARRFPVPHRPIFPPRFPPHRHYQPFFH
ncbi:uncharacterized protein LOC144618608 [Crassostrea virginica]